MFNKRSNDFPKSISCYLKEIGEIPLLTAEEEVSLGYRARSGDETAIRKLTESNLRFVIKIAKRFRASGIPLEDLINEGNLGLMEAARRFNPDKKVRFTSYAVWWIRQSLFSYLAENSRMYAVPNSMNTLLFKISRDLCDNYLENPGEKLDAKVFAKKYGVALKKVESALAILADTHSLDETADRGEFISGKRLSDSIASNSPTPDKCHFEKVISEVIDEAQEILDAKEKIALRHRFGLRNENGEYEPVETLKTIGQNRLKVSRERVRQIEERALVKLRGVKKLQSLAS